MPRMKPMLAEAETRVDLPIAPRAARWDTQTLPFSPSFDPFAAVAPQSSRVPQSTPAPQSTQAPSSALADRGRRGARTSGVRAAALDSHVRIRYIEPRHEVPRAAMRVTARVTNWFASVAEWVLSLILARS